MKTTTYIAFGLLFMLIDAYVCLTTGHRYDVDRSVKAAVVWPVSTVMLLYVIANETQESPPLAKESLPAPKKRTVYA